MQLLQESCKYIHLPLYFQLNTNDSEFICPGHKLHLVAALNIVSNICNNSCSQMLQKHFFFFDFAL